MIKRVLLVDDERSIRESLSKILRAEDYEVVLAENTLTFNENDISYFVPLFIRSVAVFGFAWVDLGAGQAVVAVIHPTIGGDSHQNPDGWHTHPEQPGNWRVVAGILIGDGPRASYLYSDRGDYKDFHLRVEARIKH